MAKKIVRVLDIIETDIENDEYEVSAFDVTCSSEGVLKIGHIISPFVGVTMFAPEVWKYVEIIEEDENGQEEKETEERNSNSNR